MKEIKLTNSELKAIVDDEDFDMVSSHGTFYLNDDGYPIRTKLPHVLLHNLLLPVNPPLEVDHKDTNKLNATRDNLRYATRSQNRANRPAQANSTTGYKGVYLEKRTGKFFARIQKDRKVIHLGTFFNEIEAAEVYDEAAIKHFGEFAFLNFPLTAEASVKEDQ